MFVRCPLKCDVRLVLRPEMLEGDECRALLVCARENDAKDDRRSCVLLLVGVSRMNFYWCRTTIVSGFAALAMSDVYCKVNLGIY